MKVVPKNLPLSSSRLLIGSVVAVILLSFAGIRLSTNSSWVVFFDNLHWTLTYILAAAMAWLGVQRSSGIERETRIWFFRGLAAFAFGQILWDIQVYTGWNPFPGPSDLFFLMLGLGCGMGLVTAVRGQLTVASQRTLMLDTAMLSMPVLALTLALYLPEAMQIGALQLMVLVAYPMILLTVSCIAMLLVLYLRPRLDWPWLVFLGALVLEGVIWMHWNGLTMRNALEDGALFNMSFSVVTPVLGFAAMHWRVDTSDNPRFCEWCRSVSNLLPLLGVLIAGSAVFLVLIGSFLLNVRIVVMTAALAVLVVAVVRQSLLLNESERMLRMEQELKDSQVKLKVVLDNLGAYVYMKDMDGRYLYANRQVCELWGCGPDDVVGAGDEKFFDAATAARLRDNDRHVLDRGEVLKYEETNTVAATGTTASYWSVKLPLRHEDGSIYALVGISTDITDRKKAEEKLRLAAKVFTAANEGITITDARGIIIDVNPTFCEITGYSREEIIGQNPRVLGSGRQSSEFYKEMWAALAEAGHWKGEIWNRRKNGELYAERLTISAVRDEAGNTSNFIGLFSDITQYKHQQEALELMAHYDELTHLPNRVLFSDRFNRAMARSKRENTLLALCYLDLDGFKQVNDTMGHEAGDCLLVEVAERIKSNLREEDTVSRMGGDEFAILMGDLQTLEQCELALTRIHQALALPYAIEKEAVNISASSGITLYPMDDADPDTLLRHADQAMYQAKSEGRNRYHLFDAAHDQEIQSQRQKLSVIEDAFARNEFCLFYQPKVDMTTGEVIGAEALIRWMHPERGLVPPIEFLPAIEGTSFEIVVGNWVIDQALRQLRQWKGEGLEIQVSVNISPLHLQWAYFFNQLEATLAMYPEVSSPHLQLEVLESSVLGDLTAIGRVLQSCRDALGVSVALDDFGTGYSSLTHLRHLPANTVKVDQSFVRNMIDDPDDYAIVEGVVGLSGAFRREVIAEGVETREHGLMLLILGCTLAQGYGVARPMPASALMDWIRNYQPDAKWLDAARSPLSPSAAQVLMLMIESHQWVRRVEDCLNAPPGKVVHWPIMNHQKCHSGRWMVRAVKEQYFDPALIERLSLAHIELHHIGGRLMQQYQEGKIEEARAGTGELRAAQGLIEGLLSVMA